MTDSGIWLAIVLIVIVIIFASLSVVLLIRVRRHERQYKALINVLRNEIRSITGGSIGMGKRLVDVEHRLNITSEKQLELENRDPGELAYNQAARLMEMGAGVDDLVKSCGIGRPEAELMALLHKELQANPGVEYKN